MFIKEDTLMSTKATKEERGFSTRALDPKIPWLLPHTHIMPIFLTSTYTMDSLDSPADQAMNLEGLLLLIIASSPIIGRRLDNEDFLQLQAEVSRFTDQKFTFKYPRIAHPNGESLEHTIASLEGGEAAACAADGMRTISLAMASILHPQRSGTIVSTSPLYSDTYRFFMIDLVPRGKQYTLLNSPEFCADEFKNIVMHAPPEAPVEVLFIETPANPTLTIWDIKALCNTAHEYDIPVIVDSTFATPYNCRPLKLGADLVIQSLTKYYCGNGTTLGGAVIGSHDRIKEIKERRQREGGHLHPMAAWLIQVGLQTFEMRMERHNKNAALLARFLNIKKNRRYIAKIYYPGFSAHAGHAAAREQMRMPNGKPGFGGMVSFELARKELVKPFVETLAQHLELAVSLGSTKSMFSVPALQIHSSLPPEERTALGISDTLIRFSVGVEDFKDIRYAFEEAFKSVS